MNHCPYQNGHERPRREAGYTLIELLEFILAAAIATFLAERLAAHFHDAMHTVVFYAVTIIGTLGLGLSFMIGFGHIFNYFDRRKARKQIRANDKSTNA